MFDTNELQKQYRNMIEKDFLPYWEKAFDLKHGGVFTCYSNDGATQLSTDKYVWSQGRMLWVLARACEQHDRGLISIPRAAYAVQCDKTFSFIAQHALLEEDGVCAYLLTQEGEKKESIPGKGFYTSYFVDCFVIMGFMEYARVFHKEEALLLGLSVYDKMMGYITRGELVSQPYPVRQGLNAHSQPMILGNVCQVCLTALEAFDHPRAPELRHAGRKQAERVLTQFYDPEIGLIREMITDDPETYNGSMLTRHIAPGHALEDLWFCMDILGQEDPLMPRIYQLIERNMEIGWDSVYGGLHHFTDQNGDIPTGFLLQDPYEDTITGTWDSKLWWVHSEALYTTLRAYVQTGEERFYALYEKLSAYVFRVFPNPNREIGEWIQIHDRDGSPMDKVVALPVKDPYHILRNLLLIVELLQ